MILFFEGLEGLVEGSGVRTTTHHNGFAIHFLGLNVSKKFVSTAENSKEDTYFATTGR
jgi:hypothetical protein